jgi:hypothetical protein
VILRHILAFSVAGILAHASPLFSQSFELVDLGTLPGTNASSARAINDDGLVVGMAGTDRLFLWQQSTGIRDLAAPNPLPSQDPRVNASGQIAGVWRRAGATYPFLWEDGAFRELPQPAVSWVQAVERLTDGGIALFRGPTPTGDCPRQSAALFQGALYDISGVLGTCWDARDVDDGLRIAGSLREQGPFASFTSAVWSPAGVRGLPAGRPYFVPNTFQRIGPGGHLAGTQGSQASRLFLLGPGNDYFEIDSPGGSFFPSGVNLLGEVTANARGTLTTTPFLLRNQRLIDLTAIAAGYTVLFASDINRHGHIAGMARLMNGEVHAVVLKPSDYPRDLQAAGSGNQVTLAWVPPPGAPSGSSYLLHVGSSTGSANVFSANLGSVTTISGGVPNGTYFAWVTMVYPNGAWSGTSNEVTFTVPAAPLAPTGLSFSLAGRRLTLSWTPPAGGAVTFLIEAGSQTGTSNVFNGNVGGAPSLSAEVPPGTYYIRVRAVSAGGMIGPVSNEVVAIVP